MPRCSPSFLVSVLALCSTACVFEPTNETELSSTREPVTFRGVSIVPRAVISIDASPRAAGPFEEIATTVGDAAPFVWGGATLYEFEVSASVPADGWLANCAGFETFVRVRGGSAVLTTYDSDQLGADAPEDCVSDLVDAGAPFVFAAQQCSSPVSSALRLTAPGPGASAIDLAGDLEITNYRHAGDWECLTSVDGDLIVSDPYPEDIAFPSLHTVAERLLLTYGHGGGLAGRTIDAPQLVSVGGDLDLVAISTDSGAPFVDVDVGLPALTDIGGDLNLDSSSFGATQVSYSGLEGLTALPGNLTINANVGDNSWGAFAPVLGEISGYAFVDLGFSVSDAFDAVATVGGDLDVRVNSWIGGNGGFDALVSVGGDFHSSGAFLFADDYPVLASVGGDFELQSFSLAGGAGSHFPMMGSVGGVLAFRNMDDSIASFGSPAVSVGGIILDSNSGLGDLESTLSGIALDPLGPATFTGNSGITNCDAQAWLDAIPGYSGAALISGNDPC